MPGDRQVAALCAARIDYSTMPHMSRAIQYVAIYSTARYYAVQLAQCNYSTVYSTELGSKSGTGVGRIRRTAEQKGDTAGEETRDAGMAFSVIAGTGDAARRTHEQRHLVVLRVILTQKYNTQAQVNTARAQPNTVQYSSDSTSDMAQHSARHSKPNAVQEDMAQHTVQ